MQLIQKEFSNYAHSFTTRESDILKELREETERELEYSDMISGPVVGGLLQLLIKTGGIQHVLEIGTFTGYGTLTMAEALPDEGTVTTIDLNEKFIKIARHFFARSAHTPKINMKAGDALEIIPTLNQTYGLIFMDADKCSYPNYYKLVLPKLEQGGILVVDNAFWSGKVLDDTDEKGQAIHRLNGMIKDDQLVEQTYLTVRDGLNLVRKASS